MKVLVIGSGGREHALAWKSAQDISVEQVFVAPGNAGTAMEEKISNVPLNIDKFDSVKDFCIKKDIELVIIGPEQPLVNGLADFLQNNGINAFGPSKYAAQLEGSKTFSKNFFIKHGIPTAQYASFSNFYDAVDHLKKIEYPTVVKADGLASGKGVIICDDQSQAEKALKSMFKEKAFGRAGNRVVIEDFLEGEEASFIAVVSKDKVLPLVTSQDHKPVGEGDIGLNTGGMGAYSPSRLMNDNLEKKILKKIIEPTLKGVAELGTKYKGFLYAGLMIVNNEPYLIEYNVRMGDPECQTIVPKLNTDIVDIILSCVNENLKNINISWNNQKSICVVLCSKGYPEMYKKNVEIKNLNKLILDNNNYLFHAGTKNDNNQILAIGGRVLNFVSLSNDFFEGRKNILSNLERLNWDEGFFRKDIAFKVIKK